MPSPTPISGAKPSEPPSISGQNISATPARPSSAPSATRGLSGSPRKTMASRMLVSEASEKMTESSPDTT